MCSLTKVEKVTGKPLTSKMIQTKTTMDAINFALQLENILDYNPDLLPSGLLPSKSVAVFFRMRSWLAHFVLYIIQRDEYVRDQVVRLGYRILAPLDQGPFSVICGYNIRKCPEGVGEDGISLVDGFAPHRHRDLVDKLSREYHERVYACESAEDSGSESCGEPVTPVLVSPLPSERGVVGASQATQIQTRTISAAEAGAAVAAASEAVGLSERLRLWKELDAVRTTCRQTYTQVRRDGRETYRVLVVGW
jgi:hypothetical protein